MSKAPTPREMALEEALKPFSALATTFTTWRATIGLSLVETDEMEETPMLRVEDLHRARKAYRASPSPAARTGGRGQALEEDERRYLIAVLSEGFAKFDGDPEARGVFDRLEQKGLLRIIEREGGDWRVSIPEHHDKILSALKSTAPTPPMTIDGVSLIESLSTVLQDVAPAIESLSTDQRQLDADGCMVGVSRQAVDEVVTAVEFVSHNLRELTAAFHPAPDDSGQR